MSQPGRSRPSARGLRALVGVAGLRRLVMIRVLSSFGDGAFQGALVSEVLFNPEKRSGAAAIAAGFAVLLLPYSVIGPFAGALLDRWSRRATIIGATALRAVLIGLLAVELAVGSHLALLFVTALAITGAGRFVASGLSAALPHTIAADSLIGANALATTIGAIAATAGGGYAIALRDSVGSGNTGPAVVTAGVVLFYSGAATLTARFAPDALGPDETDEPAQPLRAVLAGLAGGLRHAIRRPTVGLAIAMVVLVRFAFGLATLLILLLYQHKFTHRVGPLLAGLNGLAEVLALLSLGLLLGAVLAPVAARAIGRTRLIGALMLLGTLTVLVCGPMFSLIATIVAAPILALVYQASKVCADSIVQSDCADAYVGRVFALYDTLNNIFYVAAFAIGATFVPYDGGSLVLVFVMAAVYLAAGVGYVSAAGRLAAPATAGRRRLA